LHGKYKKDSGFRSKVKTCCPFQLGFQVGRIAG
jgi:hypothetical protein